MSLRRLAEKLYRRNPREWRKIGVDGVDTAVARIFDGNHGWRFEELGYRRDIDALQIAFQPEYPGDRVTAFIVGLSSMVQTAFGNKVEFYLLDELDAQRIYNAARNVEIAAWKLASARDASGQPLLLSNEIGEVTNLSFEREFGRIIGQLEVLYVEKSQQMLERMMQETRLLVSSIAGLNTHPSRLIVNMSPGFYELRCLRRDGQVNWLKIHRSQVNSISNETLQGCLR